MPRCLVFDDGLGRLAPLTDLRPAFDVRTGAFTMLERARAVLGPDAALAVPGEVAPLARRRHGLPVNPPLAGADPILILNGRAPLAVELAAHLTPGTVLVERATGHVLAGLVPAERATAVITGDTAGLQAVPVDGLNAMTRPWHVRSLRDRSLAFDLALLARPGHPMPTNLTVVGPHPVSVHPSARVLPGVVFDAEHGPVAVAEHAVIRPGAVVIGPASIGPHATIMDRAVIRPGTAVGPSCKVGGEVGGSVFQGYANKAHDGYLGDSWIGEWVNLGAGTTTSNLLNTYGEVKACPAPGEPPEPTGETFLGATIGDHAKTAIGTRVMTGAVIGTGAMFAASMPLAGNVPSFSWITDAGTTAWRPDRFFQTARAMMARRGVEPTDEYVERVRSLMVRSTA